MAKGDHVYISFFFDGFPVTHHGIDCGDGNIIHYNMQRVAMIPKTQFGKGRTLHVKEYGKCDSDNMVVERAKSKLSEEAYNVFFNNCEHFAYFCKTGKHESEQLKKLRAIGSGVVAGSIVSAGTKLATQEVAKAATVTYVDPLTQVIMNTAIQQGPTVVGRTAGSIVGVGGLVSGVATNLVVRKILDDNETLPQSERIARKNARRAGRVASTTGGIAGTFAAAKVGGGAAVAVGVAAPAVLAVGVCLLTYRWTKVRQNRIYAFSLRMFILSNRHFLSSFSEMSN
ncbi:MAG: lecithin retinol acyltransferase family protein [Scytonema sp. PMC 1069.18]|nr:lecithin retinol acyltransferase family protein [Scytonema sp. PMC 1069.18]MEC4879997.1 lecithin retinol acyltransferase family protein [Scytonema sp. PMC 1070.18]